MLKNLFVAAVVGVATIAIPAAAEHDHHGRGFFREHREHRHFFHHHHEHHSLFHFHHHHRDR